MIKFGANLLLYFEIKAFARGWEYKKNVKKFLFSHLWGLKCQLSPVFKSFEGDLIFYFCDILKLCRGLSR